jgi:hypothetical protein
MKMPMSTWRCANDGISDGAAFGIERERHHAVEMVGFGLLADGFAILPGLLRAAAFTG